jgi:aspartyl aminopeptidase
MLQVGQSSSEAARRFIAFVNASPTPFHAVHNASVRLESSGFTKVSRTTDIELMSRHNSADQGSRRLGEDSATPREILFYPVSLLSRYSTVSVSDLYFSNQSSLVAFTIPPNWKPGAGLSIVATHVDSPNLRVIL